MIFLISYHPLLKEDLYQAANWYDLQLQGLGNRFIDEFDNTVRKISKNPFSVATYVENFRQVKIDSFPYILVYEVEDQNILFQKLIHASMDPRKRIRKAS